MNRYFVLILLLTAPPALAQSWELDEAASTVGFETQALGNPFSGVFERFGAEILMDPNDLANASIEAWVDVASVRTDAPDVDAELTADGGFAPEDHPRAVFISTTIVELDGCHVEGAACYVAEGELTLRGASHPMRLEFSLVVEDERAIADGTMILFRDDFRIGTEEWGVAGFETTVILHIEAILID